MTKNSSPKRTDALAQLKIAKRMLSEGESELGRAQAKIKRARELIEQSADLLRETWKER
jgi:hypothetical protein